MAKVLIIEDEPKIAALMKDYLMADNHQTHIVADGALALAQFSSFQPDIVLLDIMLPNKNGLEICKEIRQLSDCGMIMVTAKVEEVDRLIGLDIGADDYICKPFSPKEVVARVNVLWRRLARLEGQANNSPEAAWQIDEEKMQITYAQQRLQLTHTEFRILAQLMKHVGKIYSRSQLLDLVYDDFRDNNDRAIDSHIKNLRKKLKQACPDKEVLKSVYGVGYKVEL